MTVPPSRIWTSAATALRQSNTAPDAKHHIGMTLRDLYSSDRDARSDSFDDLLDQLTAAEDKARFRN